jgi:hypothetical protein
MNKDYSSGGVHDRWSAWERGAEGKVRHSCRQKLRKERSALVHGRVFWFRLTTLVCHQNIVLLLGLLNVEQTT